MKEEVEKVLAEAGLTALVGSPLASG